jgi:O-antigen/teichoic acid export membrane protein
VWWAAFYPAKKALQMGSSMVLASLLSPQIFGVVALGSVAVKGVRMFSELGLRAALIQNERDDDAFVNTAWSLQILRGVAIFLVSSALAVPIARFYDEPILAYLIPVLGLCAVIQGFESTKYITLNRQLEEKKRAVLEFAFVCVGSLATISVALFWQSAWALVCGSAVGGTFFLVATHRLPGPRNRLAWDGDAARSIFRFGIWIFIGTVIAFLGAQLDKIVLGKLVSEHLSTLGLVGVYVLAQRLSELPAEAAQLMGGQIALPVLCEIARSDRRRFAHQFRRLRRLVLVPGLSLCVGVFAFSPIFFELFYDDRYAAASWMAPLLTIRVWIGLLNGLLNRALLALGLPRVLAATGLIGVVGSFCGALAGFYAWGVPGFILGLCVGGLARHVCDHVALARRGCKVFTQDFMYSLGACAGGGVIWLCQSAWDDSGSTIVRVLTSVGIPALVFTAFAVPAGVLVLRTLRGR